MAEDLFIRAIPPEIRPITSFRAHTDSIDFIKLNERNSPATLVSAGHDDLLKIWDLNTQRTLTTLRGHSEGIFCCDISDSGQIISCSPDKTVRLWDPRSGNEVSRGLGHTYKIYYVLFADSTHVVSCGRDRMILLWDTKKMNAPIMRYGNDNCGTFRSLALQNNFLLATTAESGLEGFEFKSGKEIFKEKVEYDLSVFPEGTEFLDAPEIIYSAKFFRTGEFLTTHQDMAIRKFRYNNRLEHIFLRRGHYDFVRYVEIDKNEEFYVTTGQDGSVRVWRENNPTASLVGHTQIASCACITADSARVITCSYDQNINIYNVR